MKNIFIKVIAVFFVFFSVYSQQAESYEIGLKDYHSADILDIKLTKDNKYIYTSDDDGKVLMFDAKTLDFVKTVKSPENIPILGMRLANHDSILMMSQGYVMGFRPEYDSLVIKNVYSDVVKKQQFSFDFIDLDIDNYFGTINYDESQRKYIFTFFTENLESLAVVPLQGVLKPKIASVSHDFSKMSYVSIPGKEIIIVDLKTKEETNRIVIPEEEDVISLFFDKISNDIFAVTTQKDEEKVKIYNLNSGKFDNPVYTVDYYASSLEKVISQYDGQKHLIVLSGEKPSSESLLIIRDKDGFNHQYIYITNQEKIKSLDRDFSYQEVSQPVGATDAVVNTERKEIIFANHSPHNEIRNFSVYNYDKRKITKVFPQITDNFYSSVFLPDNSWIVLKTGYGEDIIDEDIKYFEAGTFNNRFHTLSFKDYLETQHNITAYYARLFEDKGIAVIYGNDSDFSTYSNYYVYDFIKDTLTQITDTQIHAIHLQDYNLEKNILLLSQGVYYNQGHTESVKLEIIIDNQIIPIEGDYKFGKLTNDGNYLLTINKDNLIEIRTVENRTTIFTEELKEGSYILYSIDESVFMISNSYRYLDINECNKETYTFEIKGNEVTRTAIPCVVIKDVGQGGESAGLIMEGYGVAINDTTIPFTKSNFPESISFNHDGSRFILSFNNGKNAVYDRETLQPLGYMIHPDSKTHIFYDVNHNYFSNIDPEQFLYATKNGQNIPISQVGNEFFNPEKILELFGTPNRSYLTALNKAIQFRKDYYTENQYISYQRATSTDAISEKEDSHVKPDLYLLSIGVSDYKDNSYTLTFPEKDAIDIAKIYGEFSEEELKGYYNKFFGTKYTLYNQDNEPLSTINNYTGIYNSSGSKYLLNTDGNIWLEDKYGKYFIWNYKNKTIDSLSLPELDNFYSDLNELIFVKPDNTGFYLKGKEEFFEYLFATGKFVQISLPFEPTKKNFMPLSNNSWIHFDDKFFERQGLTITIGEFNSDKPQTRFSLKYSFDEKIRDILSDGTIKTDSITPYFKEFKTASSDGRYVFYAMGDSEIFFLDLYQKELIPTRLPIRKKQIYCKISVDSENQRFYIIETSYDSDEKQLTYYDFSGKNLGTFKFDLSFGNNGIVNNGKSYYYIDESEGTLSTNIFNNTDKTLETGKPPSFENVYVKYIVNENANSKTIKEELKTFFDKANPNDQIMVFLAGHGVLGIDNDYYFAPYDMDFDNVDKNGISFENIVESLQKSPAQNKLLLMDTCHSGRTIDLDTDSYTLNSDAPKVHNKGDRGAKVIMGTTPKYKISEVISSLFEDFLSNSGITIISASSGGDLAQEHANWGNGAFTSSYIKILKKKIGGDMGVFSLDEQKIKNSVLLNDSFIDDLYKEVINLTDKKQVPDLREINKRANINLW